MECPDTPKEKAKELLRKHREEIREKRKKKGMNKLSGADIENIPQC